jgi:hypothetical protein
MDIGQDKNNKLNKELTTSDEVLMNQRIFNFYYFVLRKKDLNLFLCVLFLILETLQMISYAFSDPVDSNNANLWGLNLDTMDNLKKILTSVRLAPLLNASNVGFSLYVAIWGCMIAYVFFHTLVMAMAMRINKITSKFYQIIVSFTCYFTLPLSTFFLIPIAGKINII